MKTLAFRRLKPSDLTERDIEALSKMTLGNTMSDMTLLTSNLQNATLRPTLEAYVRISVIYVDNVPVGWACIESLPEYSTAVLDVYVQAKYRRRGYGTKLVADLQEYVKLDPVPNLPAVPAAHDQQSRDFFLATFGEGNFEDDSV